MKIIVTYCSNYNGAYLYHPEDAKSRKCVSAIVDRMTDECGEDGYFEGDKDFAKDTITQIVKDYYGEDTEVVVEFDRIST